jgi:hypothetical protein
MQEEPTSAFSLLFSKITEVDENVTISQDILPQELEDIRTLRELVAETMSPQQFYFTLN